MLAQLNGMELSCKERQQFENSLFELDKELILQSYANATIVSMETETRYLQIVKEFVNLSQRAYHELVKDRPSDEIHVLALPENPQVDDYLKLGLLYQHLYTTIRYQMDWERLHSRLEDFCGTRPTAFDSLITTLPFNEELIKQVYTIKNSSQSFRTLVKQLDYQDRFVIEKCTSMENILKDLSGAFVTNTQQKLINIRNTLDTKRTLSDSSGQVDYLNQLSRDISDYQTFYNSLQITINQCFDYLVEHKKSSLILALQQRMVKYDIQRKNNLIKLPDNKLYSQEYLLELRNIFYTIKKDIRKQQQLEIDTLDSEILSYQEFFREKQPHHTKNLSIIPITLAEKQEQLNRLKDRFIDYQNNDALVAYQGIRFNPDSTVLRFSRNDLDSLSFIEVKKRFDVFERIITSARRRIVDCMTSIDTYNRLLLGAQATSKEKIISTALNLEQNVVEITEANLVSLEQYKNDFYNFMKLTRRIQCYHTLLAGDSPNLRTFLPVDMQKTGGNDAHFLAQAKIYEHYNQIVVPEFRSLLPQTRQASFDTMLARVNACTGLVLISNIFSEEDQALMSLKHYQNYYTWSRKIKDKLKSNDSDLTNQSEKITRFIEVLDVEFKSLTFAQQVIVNKAFEYLIALIDRTKVYDETTWNQHKAALQSILPETSNTWRLFKTWAPIVLGAALIGGAITLACVSFGAGAVLIPMTTSLALNLTESAVTAVIGLITGMVGTVGVTSLAYGIHRLFQSQKDIGQIYHEALVGCDEMWQFSSKN